ncbi:MULTISPECIES: type IV toxin-antitoxin system AbiEi family antitoxin [unclassified Duganella]|uniref:type IV toxin-antitoxin system AbiEi family antitoxin n=1 Tax=unclassified Duganella TaxID=2636909 RepID=UPI000E351517|nr:MULTISPECIES: type IV toxin-antitoxin system AbiEi family antitoxin [unclassified Duganella]RFP08283.1 hypothetical protein D0T23_29230 [Duganella sp. BJB475]RFP22515.1 hypothetical protein D0T21_30195 [Duganella sp. BJB476]
MNQFEYDVGQTLLHEALASLRHKTDIQGTVVNTPPKVAVDHEADASVDLVLDGQTHHYLVECKTIIDRKAQIDQIDLRSRQMNSPLMLVTHYMSKELAMHCRAVGLQFIDTHGNAYLRAPGLLVFTVGEKNERRHQFSKAPKGLTNAASLRVIFTLLSKPELVSATFKEVAALSGVALGSAYNVLEDLEGRGYLLAGTKQTRKLLEPNRLMEEWVTNFPTTLRPKLNSRRFSSPDPYWWKNVDIADFHAVWGSEVAAVKMFKHLSPSTQTLYVDAMDMRNAINALAKNIRLKPDPYGPIEVLEKFWSSDIETIPGIAPPLLVYSDLLSLLDPRAKEMANIIKEKFIEPTINPS